MFDFVKNIPDFHQTVKEFSNAVDRLAQCGNGQCSIREVKSNDNAKTDQPTK